MVWNHRVVKRVYKRETEEETTYAIHEAYYPEVGEPADSITVDPVAVVGESIDELKQTLERMLRALDKDVLEYEKF